MSRNRKLRRAQQSKRAKTSQARPLKGKAELRQQSSGQRFTKPGAEQLWASLLGWDETRQQRICLADAVHDGALWKKHTASGADGDAPPYDPKAVIAQFAQRCPKVGTKLEVEDADLAVDAWIASGEEYDASTPPTKWGHLANLSEKLGLGEVRAHDFQEDWETWVSPALAGRLRTALMEMLGQTEQVASSLNEVVKSDNITAMMGVMRVMWSALAYGDETTFKRVRGWAESLSPPTEG